MYKNNLGQQNKIQQVHNMQIKNETELLHFDILVII